MQILKSFMGALFAVMFVMGAAGVARADVAHMTVGAGGYDLVSYQTNTKPLRGSGDFALEHDGVSYLFASDANREAFKADPAKYLPAYGGYCAYGVSVGKKFYGDPEGWRVVDGTLYLNLNTKVQDLWLEDVAGKVSQANTYWKDIKDKPASEL